MAFLYEYGLYLAKALTLVVAVLVVLAGILALVGRQRRPSKAGLEIRHLNKHYETMQKRVEEALASHNELNRLYKAEQKSTKKKAKAEKKSLKKGGAAGSKHHRLFVLNFDGDVRAKPVASMREEISAILTVATPQDEVLLRLESGGGLVSSYGLAASQLARLRDANIPLTISIDKIAASGGYMMACVGSKVIAAPFAMVGSIGVIAQIPNLHRFLKKRDIDFEMHHAGEFKRTLTLFGENTDAGREKLREDLEETHLHFKNFISQHRPSLDIERVATGETWLGTKALELGLVDVLQTSDDYLMQSRSTREIMLLEFKEKKGVMGSLGSSISKVVAGLQKPEGRHDTYLM